MVSPRLPTGRAGKPAEKSTSSPRSNKIPQNTKDFCRSKIEMPPKAAASKGNLTEKLWPRPRQTGPAEHRRKATAQKCVSEQKTAERGAE